MERPLYKVVVLLTKRHLVIEFSLLETSILWSLVAKRSPLLWCLGAGAGGGEVRHNPWKHLATLGWAVELEHLRFKTTTTLCWSHWVTFVPLLWVVLMGPEGRPGASQVQTTAK